MIDFSDGRAGGKGRREKRKNRKNTLSSLSISPVQLGLNKGRGALSAVSREVAGKVCV